MLRSEPLAHLPALLALALAAVAVPARAEARLISQAPVLPVVFNKNKFLIRPEVQGWYPTLLDQHPFTAVKLVPAKGD
jgi:hypothetical protein